MLKDEGYYNNLCYYYIQHFAKHIKSGALLMHIENNSNIEVVSFKNADGSIATILLNKTDEDSVISLNVGGNTCTLKVKSHSIITII